MVTSDAQTDVTGAGAHPAPRLTNPARTLRIAGGAGLAVAVITVGALVVVPSLNRPPLFTAAAASGSPQASAMGSRDSVSSESMKIGWWVDYHYNAGSGLSTSGGSGQVYQLVRDGAPEDRAATIADVFGVDGSVAVASYSDPSYPMWVVGPEDGSAPTVSVTWSGTGDWSFSDPTATSFYICDPSIAADQAIDYGCIMPADAPENKAPGEADARAQAQTLLAATGFAVDASDIIVYAEDWGTSATANLTVDGTKTALDSTISWSNTGAISYAYGHSVTVESRGSYGTVSAVDAVDRLADGRWWGSAGPDYQGGGAALYAADAKLVAPDTTVSGPGATTDVVTDDPAATPEPAPAPADGQTPEPAPIDEPTAEPAPGDPIPVDPIPVPDPTPEVVDVTIDTAEATLLLMWDADGNAWLVPGYAMQVEEGWWSSVVSLVEGVIALPEAIVIEPGVPEGGIAD